MTRNAGCQARPMPPTTATTCFENQGMRPKVLRQAAMAMRAANQVRVSQAGPSARHSCWLGKGLGEGDGVSLRWRGRGIISGEGAFEEAELQMAVGCEALAPSR